MAFDIALARAEELELEASARVHRMSGHRDAIAIVLSCSCGWTRKILRRQNAPGAGLEGAQCTGRTSARDRSRARRRSR